MDENQELSTQIQKICHYINLAVKEEVTENIAYKAYSHAFETALRNHISRIDPNKQAAIQEIIHVIFIIYDDMLDGAKNEIIQTEKLAKYIENLLVHVQNDADYILHWSMQSCIDALLQTSQLHADTPEDLEDMVDQGLKELDELLHLEEQKIDILNADHLFDDDDDQLSADMEKILALNTDTMQREAAFDLNPLSNLVKTTEKSSAASDAVSETASDVAGSDTDLGYSETASALDPVDNAAEKITQWYASSNSVSDTTTVASESDTSLDRSQHSFDSDDSRATKNESIQIDEEEARILNSFSEKFHKIVSAFNHYPTQQTANAKFKNSVEHVSQNIIEAYNICFQEGISAKNLHDFSEWSQSIIENWSYYWDSEDQPPITQVFAKLSVSLAKLTDDTRHQLESISVNSQQPKPH